MGHPRAHESGEPAVITLDGYIIHSIEPDARDSEVTLPNGDTATARVSLTTVELVCEGRPTLTISVPASRYAEIGAVGDTVTITVEGA